MADLNLSMDEAEAGYLSDILQMWLEGIDAEVANLTDETDEKAHWAKYGLRKQYKAAGAMKLRLDMERGLLQ